jgi:hypothetical protein
LLLPLCTLPKLNVEGEADNTVVVVPVPERAMFTVVALEVMAMLPLALPALLGAKITEKVVLAPAARVLGRERLLRVKPVPLNVALEIVTLPVPVLLSVA